MNSLVGRTVDALLKHDAFFVSSFGLPVTGVSVPGTVQGDAPSGAVLVTDCQRGRTRGLE